MKKALTFFLGIAMIISGTEIHQLLKIPVLLSHFRDHRNENPGLSFIAFLKIHYSDDHPQDNDDREDNELPFKSIGDIAHIDTPVLEKRIVTIAKYNYSKKHFTFYREGTPKRRSFSIFHPPRIS